MKHVLTKIWHLLNLQTYSILIGLAKIVSGLITVLTLGIIQTNSIEKWVVLKAIEYAEWTLEYSIEHRLTELIKNESKK